MGRAQIEVWWVSGDGVGGLLWVGITGTSDKEAGALRCSFNRAKCPTFLLNSPHNLLHLRNTGRIRASPTFDDLALFLPYDV